MKHITWRDVQSELAIPPKEESRKESSLILCVAQLQKAISYQMCHGSISQSGSAS